MQDSAVPPGLEAAAGEVVERRGVVYGGARWTPPHVARLVRHLSEVGARRLAGLSDDAIHAAWSSTVEAFLDPTSAERHGLLGILGRLCLLSPAGLAAALETVLGGVGPEPARELLRQARGRRGRGLVAVVLPSNLPALAVQPLLCSLAVRRPVLLKTPSSEPLFTPAFVRALTRREPRLADAVAAVTWRGGEVAIEAPVLQSATSVLAYGEETSIDDLRRRASGQVLAFGPRLSLAVIDRSVAADRIARGLALDIALFDQRGCLSIQAVITDGDPKALAVAVACGLRELADRLPPGPIDPVSASRVQQLRAEAAMRGLFLPPLPLAAGTVVVEPVERLLASPGLRTVRIHPLSALEAIGPLLAGWRGRLQGAALAGAAAWGLEQLLVELGVSRCAAPGELQRADVTWHNGGRHPLEALL